jgi:deoxyribodipyrimidine photo-lyase
MARLLVQNNLFWVSTIPSENEILFAPVYYSRNQFQYHQSRFTQLKKRFKQVKWVEAIDDDDFDHALAWNALYEKSAFGPKLLPVQNRLFDQLPFELPASFTPFRILAEKHLPAQFSDAVTPWDDEVLRELTYYFEQNRLPLTYLDTRNALIGRDNSTRFSAFLSSGVLHVKYLYNRIRVFESQHGATKSTYWIIFELLWREFFYWHYQRYPREYFSKNGLKDPLDFSPIPDISLEELRGMCSIPFYHAALAELESTGFLSNRARQIFASIWINDLELDWRAGARLFEEHLIDYDVYSNWGNWMYLAGVGVDPRGKRYFNVEKQLETYDPEGEYLRTWGNR